MTWALRLLWTKNADIGYHHPLENRTQPKTVGQWIRYIFFAAIAIVLVWSMLRMYVL